MKLKKLTLLKNKQEYFRACLFLALILFLSTLYEYTRYKNFKKSVLYEDAFSIVSFYKKESFYISKLSNNDFTFYSKIPQDYNLNDIQNIQLLLLTKNISFYSYLKGFYTNSIVLYPNNASKNTKNTLSSLIKLQHKNTAMQELYQALFLGESMGKDLRKGINTYGVSHLFAISGFHLGVIVLVFYFILHLLYKNIHQQFFPYRNKRMDILLCIFCFLFFYLYLIGFLASFLRAFIMFCIALALLRSHIKLFSFTSLLLTFILILCFFPKYIFSLSLYFSLAGVFYIFLYFVHLKNLNKKLSFFFFNIWIFAALNPIIHYFFPLTSLYQLFSPLLSLLFILFYPFVLFLHLLKQGSFFDCYLLEVLSYDVVVYNYDTNIYFLCLYIVISFLSIKSRKAFIVLNVLLLVFNLKAFVLGV